jgi:pyridoxamine 5'-phosphate oxidase
LDESLGDDRADPDPLRQFRRWLADAAARADLHEPDAMALATATADGRPSARMVLLRGVDERGLTFYTNYRSRKGAELGANPRAAGLFYWDGLGRQVRVEGTMEPVDPAESDAYWSARPRASRIAASISPQSVPVPDRAWLDERFGAMDRDAPEEPPRPHAWGGYRLVPDEWEFWVNRPNRLHDRLRYRRAPGGHRWLRERLAP